MKILKPSGAVAAALAVFVCGCRSRPGADGGKESASSTAPSGYLHYADARFAFDYPSEFTVKATPASGEELLMIEPKMPPRGSTTGAGTIQPDPIHPDMLLDDEVDSVAKTPNQPGSRVIGGVRRLQSKNGTCKGFVAIDPWKPCPANAPFKPASSGCYDTTLNVFCQTPAGKRLIYVVGLGPVPTADQLTPEAADYGRVHERILSTLEFK